MLDKCERGWKNTVTAAKTSDLDVATFTGELTPITATVPCNSLWGFVWAVRGSVCWDR